MLGLSCCAKTKAEVPSSVPQDTHITKGLQADRPVARWTQKGFRGPSMDGWNSRKLPRHRRGSEAHSAAHVMICGGPALDGPRLIWWNLVASEQPAIETAKADWTSDPLGCRWGAIAGKSGFIPLFARN